jgi:hypothetical protein
MTAKTKAKRAVAFHAKAKAAAKVAFSNYANAIDAKANKTEIDRLGNAYTIANDAVADAYSELLDADRAVEREEESI